MIYKRVHYLKKIKESIENINNILFVVGGRQVGKTTLLKSLVKFDICREEETFYLNGDEIFGDFSNGEQFLEFLRVKYGVDLKKKKYLLIDEFHFIKNIGLILKNLIDGVRRGIYNFKIICSGSGSWYSFLQKAEYLTGRYEVVKVYPFTFGEFLDYKGFKYYDFDINNIGLYISDLKLYFQEYMKFGGYPAVVVSNDLSKKKEILSNIFQDYLMKDVALFLKGEEIYNFRNFLKKLVKNLGSVFSVDSLVEELGLGRRMVEKFLFIFENTFLGKILNGLKTNLFEGEVYKKIKVYFIDLGFLNLLNDFSLDVGGVIENFVLVQVLPYISEYEQLYYRRKRTGSEIDFVILDRIDKVFNLIEVKSGKKDNIPKIIINWLNLSNINLDKVVITTESLYKIRDINGKKVIFVPYLGVEKLFLNNIGKF